MGCTGRAEVDITLRKTWQTNGWFLAILNILRYSVGLVAGFPFNPPEFMLSFLVGFPLNPQKKTSRGPKAVMEECPQFLRIPRKLQL